MADNEIAIKSAWVAVETSSLHIVELTEIVNGRNALSSQHRFCAQELLFMMQDLLVLSEERLEGLLNAEWATLGIG